MHYSIYTDGSAKGRIGTEDTYGGWAFYSVEDKVECSGAKYGTTNNEMELTAIREAILHCFVIFSKDKTATFTIYSDSAYSINCLTVWCNSWRKNGWINSEGKPVKNKELIQEILNSLAFSPPIQFKKVKGHVGVLYNEKVDSMAQREAYKLKLEREGE